MNKIIVKIELIEADTKESLISATVNKDDLDKLMVEHNINGLTKIYKNLLTEITQS